MASALVAGPAHHKIFMAGTAGLLGDVEAAASDLSSGGASFRNRLTPAGVNGAARPPPGGPGPRQR